MTRNRDTSRGAPRDSQGLRHVMGLAAGWVLLLVPLAAYAQSFDGTYVGTLSCPALPNGRPLSVEFSMTVSGSRASYEHSAGITVTDPTPSAPVRSIFAALDESARSRPVDPV
jgi:hypothetical protein